MIASSQSSSYIYTRECRLGFAWLGALLIILIVIDDDNLTKIVKKGTNSLFVKDHVPVLAFPWLYQQQDQVKEAAY